MEDQYPQNTLLELMQLFKSYCVASQLMPNNTVPSQFTRALPTLQVVDKIIPWKLRSKSYDKIVPLLRLLRGQPYDLKTWRQAYKLLHCMADWFVQGHNNVPMFAYPAEQVSGLVQHFQEPQTASLPVILTMTSCKRLDLLRRTLDSIITNCLDITKYVCKWVLVDDNSSIQDRDAIRTLYPFITIVEKGPEDKGHPRSMNMIYDILMHSGAKYNFHLEDDFEWWMPDHYLGKCIKILQQDSSFGQALVNFAYTEDEHTAQQVWERDMHVIPTPEDQNGESILRYFVHEYFTGHRLEIEQNLLGAPSSMYWPHFSFRPGMTKIEVYQKLGKFDESALHFEMEYADRYVRAGYRTAMMDGCYATHIGRRTYERKGHKRNAYDLNAEQQFGAAPKSESEAEALKAANSFKGKPSTPSVVAFTIPPVAKDVEKPESVQELPKPSSMPIRKQEVSEITGPLANAVKVDPSVIKNIRTFVINLKRRPERLLKFIKNNNDALPSFEVFEAVDGSALQPNIKIHKMFETSDYHYRRGLVGCAYSHFKIWSLFVKDKQSDYCVVMEDDIKLSASYKEKLMHLLDTQQGQFDVLFLHWNPYHHVVNQEEWYQDFVKPTAELWSVAKSERDNMGSGACYVLSRSAAKHMISWVNEHGMPNGVDWVLMKQPKLRVMYSKPMIAFAECWNHNTRIQSDIQTEYNCVRYNHPDELLKEEIKRWLHKDVEGVCMTSLAPMLGSLNIKDDPKSNVAFSPFYVHNYGKELGDWKVLRNRVVIVPKGVEIPYCLPVKWYIVGDWKFVVPDTMITVDMFYSIPWFDNRVNLHQV